MDQRKKLTVNDYGKISSLYAEDFGNDYQHFDFIDQLVKLITKQNLHNNGIIDLGSGPGTVIGYLLKKGLKHLTAVDITPEFCKMIEQKYQAVQVICADMVKYVKDRQANSVGAYIANYSIIHIPDEELDDFFSEIYRTLCTGGLFFMSAHKGKFKGIEKEVYQMQNDPRLHENEELSVYMNYFTEDELQKRIQMAGLSIIKMETFIVEAVAGEIDVPKIFLLAQKA